MQVVTPERTLSTGLLRRCMPVSSRRLCGWPIQDLLPDGYSEPCPQEPKILPKGALGNPNHELRCPTNICTNLFTFSIFQKNILGKYVFYIFFPHRFFQNILVKQMFFVIKKKCAGGPGGGSPPAKEMAFIAVLVT